MTQPDPAVEAVAKAMHSARQKTSLLQIPDWDDCHPASHARWVATTAATDAIAALSALGYAKRADVAEQIAMAVHGQCLQCETGDPELAAECEYRDAARIAREIGGRAGRGMADGPPPTTVNTRREREAMN